MTDPILPIVSYRIAPGGSIDRENKIGIGYLELNASNIAAIAHAIAADPGLARGIFEAAIPKVAAVPCIDLGFFQNPTPLPFAAAPTPPAAPLNAAENTPGMPACSQPTPADAGDEAAKRSPYYRACGICGEGVLWANSPGMPAHPIQYHDCKPVPGEKLDEANAELARLRAELAAEKERRERAEHRERQAIAVADHNALVIDAMRKLSGSDTDARTLKYEDIFKAYGEELKEYQRTAVLVMEEWKDACLAARTERDTATTRLAQVERDLGGAVGLLREENNVHEWVARREWKAKRDALLSRLAKPEGES